MILCQGMSPKKRRKFTENLLLYGKMWCNLHNFQKERVVKIIVINGSEIEIKSIANLPTAAEDNVLVYPRENNLQQNTIIQGETPFQSMTNPTSDTYNNYDLATINDNQEVRCLEPLTKKKRIQNNWNYKRSFRDCHHTNQDDVKIHRIPVKITKDLPLNASINRYEKWNKKKLQRQLLLERCGHFDRDKD